MECSGRNRTPGFAAAAILVASAACWRSGHSPPVETGECPSGFCAHGGCAMEAGGPTCACDEGYIGSRCDGCAEGYVFKSQACVPESPDPCNPNPCAEVHRSKCTRADGGFECACNDGYSDRCGECAPECDVSEETCAAASASFAKLVSANGFGAIVYDVNEWKVADLFEHPYRYWDAGVGTRDLLYDTYFGLRVGGRGVWLNTVAPQCAGYFRESGMVREVRQIDCLRVETRLFAPWNLPRPGLVMALRATNACAEAVRVSIYTLHNAHLGRASDQDKVNLDASDERISHDASAGAYVETGPAGTMVYFPLGAPSHRGCTPDNPWPLLTAGEDLKDNDESGTGFDRAAGFQLDAVLSPGESAAFGAAMAFAPAGMEDGLLDELKTAFAGVDPWSAVDDALAEWEAWRTPPPAGLTGAELSVYRQSESVLRMGQVRETGDLSTGQILASLPPGQWNICWPRDMSYALNALSASGHLDEARSGLEFLLQADSGYYREQVGVPYRISVARYFGRGKEESDWNEDGPNVELDGFGLFLRSLEIYTDMSGDTTLASGYWDRIESEIAGALLALTEPETGLIAADSSIWEVHWNGRQKRFTYTSLAATAGLCSASRLAAALGKAGLAADYREGADRIRNAVPALLVDADRILAGSLEELRAGAGYMDMAVMDGFNFSVLDPAGEVAAATIGHHFDFFKVGHGRGFFRNDDGGWYDSREWVFVDLRLAEALRLSGRAEDAARLLDWNTAQALANFGLIAELHDPADGRYEGSVPMVGFGAGAYVEDLCNLAAGEPLSAPCGP